MSVDKKVETDDSVTFTVGEKSTKYEIIDENIVRLAHTYGESVSDSGSLIVQEDAGADVDWSISEDGDGFTIKAPQLRVDIDGETGAVTWRTPNGDQLVSEASGSGKTLREIDVADLAEGTDLAGPHESIDREAYAAKFEFDFGDEALYGLGQHEEGISNYRGESQLLYQANLKVSMPVIVSTKGYGILWDTCALAAFHDDAQGSYFWTECTDELDIYVVYGPEFDDIIAGFRELTGQSVMSPKWLYGYVQSKERYRTANELVDVVEEYRDREIPLDTIVQDWRYWPMDEEEDAETPEGEWGQKSFDQDRFGNASEAFESIHDMDTHVLISIWPNMQSGDNHEEMNDRGFLIEQDGCYYDVFDEEARDLYWQQAERGLFDHGVDGWWCDCTEPYNPNWDWDVRPEPFREVEQVTDAFYRAIDPAYANAYSLLQAKGMYENQRRVTEDKRVVNLTRSGLPGQQRYGAITWSGDIEATWDRLEKQIADGLQFTATGDPKWTTDIGAFFVKDGDWWCMDGDYDGNEDMGYRELYVRWFQYGAFLPMFRSHGTDTPREVWRFGEPGDRFYDTLVKFDELRYRLLPYIYSLAGWETHRDYTMYRHLAFDFREDETVHDITDQFMFGPGLMVCPVTEPMYYEAGSEPLEGTAKAREVYLPEGTDWYDFWTGRKYEGGQTILADAPLQKMPLFVKAGSIVPMGPVVQHTGERIDAPWELRIYTGQDGSFDIYEDAGDGYDYEKGNYAMTPLAWDDASQEFSIEPRDGSFPEMVEEREFRVVTVGENVGTGIDEQEGDSMVIYDGTATSVTLDSPTRVK